MRSSDQDPIVGSSAGPGGAPGRAGPAEVLRLVAVAFRFLTRLPVPDVPVGDGDLRRAVGAFPLVGLVVAAVAVALRWALAPLLGVPVAVVAALAGMVVVTGALHEDGLADSADGLWGGWEPARRLEIMKDSRIGTYGVLALLGSAGSRFALLVQLDLGRFAAAVVCGQVLGRAVMPVLTRVLPPVSRGLGRQLDGPLGVAGPVAGGMLTLAAVARATRWWALVLLAVVTLVLLGGARVFRRRLGGYTGDTLGALCQVTELAVVGVVVVLVRFGFL